MGLQIVLLLSTPGMVIGAAALHQRLLCQHEYLSQSDVNEFIYVYPVY